MEGSTSNCDSNFSEEKYQAKSMWPQSSDPMIWRANHATEYKVLKQTVVKYMSASLSLVALERLFSVAALILLIFTENCNRLFPKHESGCSRQEASKSKKSMKSLRNEQF